MCSVDIGNLRERFRASIEFSKSKGRVKEYKILTNPTPAGAEDWNYAIAVRYANWAALDLSEAFTKEQGEFLDKHYGSREKRDAANSHRREM